MAREIWLDMDGTIADFYATEGWLEHLENESTFPYEVAKPLVNMNILARYLNRLQKMGYKIGILTAVAKNATAPYAEKIKRAKAEWLKKHLRSVRFDDIEYIAYTTIKNTRNKGNDILFDDEDRHLSKWTGTAVNAKYIMETLRTMR